MRSNEINTTLQSGDLIFLNNNSSDMEKAIAARTGEYSHVALVECDNAFLPDNDRLIDMGRTVMSVTGDASCAVVMQRMVGKKL